MSTPQPTPAHPSLHKRTGRFTLDIPLRSLTTGPASPASSPHGPTNGVVWGTGVLLHDELAIARDGARDGDLSTLTICHSLHAADCSAMDEAHIIELLGHLKRLRDMCVDDTRSDREPREVSIQVLESLTRPDSGEDEAAFELSTAPHLGWIRGVDASNFRLVKPVQIKEEDGKWKSVNHARHKAESDNKIHDLLDQTVEETREAWVKAVFETGGRGYEVKWGSVTSAAEGMR